MDALIKKYAEILKTAKVGDYTLEGILTEFAKEVRSYTFAETKEMNKLLDDDSMNN